VKRNTDSMKDYKRRACNTCMDDVQCNTQLAVQRSGGLPALCLTCARE